MESKLSKSGKLNEVWKGEGICAYHLVELLLLPATDTHTATTCTTMVNLIYCFIMIRLAFNSSKAVSLLSIRPVYACMLYILCCFSRLFIYLYSFNRVHLNSINYLQILRPFVCVFLMYVHWKQTLQWQF